ncbi:MAG TPA: GNAT family N-acetyltransferase [Candidatus Dormibacteraeota bacterium]
MRLTALQDLPLAFGSTYEREVQADEPDWRRRLEGRAQFVVELDGRVAGTAGGIHEDSYVALISMWVAPEARRKGAGEALVTAVLDWARHEGRHEVRLWVVDTNIAAQRLYARCGFVATGATQPVFPGEPRMELEMVRTVGSDC